MSWAGQTSEVFKTSEVFAGPLLGGGEVLQQPAAVGLPQSAEAASLDLADALAGDTEPLGHLVQGVGPAVPQAEAQLDDLPVPGGERTQDLVEPLSEEAVVRLRARVGGVAVAHQVDPA